MSRYGYNTLTLGGMVRVPGLAGRGMARFADVPIIVKLPEPETKPAAQETSSTNWSPIVNALKAFNIGTPQTATAAPQGMPQWVWVAAPLVAGLAFVAVITGTRKRPLAGYSKRRR